MPDKDGVEIYKRFYPWPESFRLGDPVLVKEVTGMRWPDFAQALDEMEEDEVPDQVVLAGLIAVAFWQGNPQMSRDKARRAVERISMDDVEILEADDGGVDASPPATDGAATGAVPSPISSASAASPEEEARTEILPDSTSDETSPNGSGVPSSLNAPPESLPA
jgi:hypothetical protein